MHYLRKENLICFSKDELEYFFKLEMLEFLDGEIMKRGIKLSELRGDNDLMDEIATSFSTRLNSDKDRIEIFAAWNVFLNFYEDNSQACFEPKPGFNISKDVIETLGVLKNAIAEATLTDFAILSKNGIRRFQLKRYREPIDEDSVFQFIIKKISEYGNIGDINLLIILQSDVLANIGALGFENLHRKIGALGYSFGGEILISYNEENKFSVINQIYPRLATSRIPIEWRDPAHVPLVKRE